MHADLQAFRDAVSNGDVVAVGRLVQLPHVHEQLNAPMFAFGSVPRTSPQNTDRCWTC